LNLKALSFLELIPPPAQRTLTRNKIESYNFFNPQKKEPVRTAAFRCQ
jgi:hypothetical protein